MESEAPRRNLELKARVADLERVRRAVAALEADHESIERQTDTYYRVAHGRLKLREIDGSRVELIWYARPDVAEARHSSYRVVPVTDAAALDAALAAALGRRGQVRKERRILLWHNVRIHLDEVRDLGSFVELEAVIRSDDDERSSPARVALLCERLGILPGDHLGPSYSDLLGL